LITAAAVGFSAVLIAGCSTSVQVAPEASVTATQSSQAEQPPRPELARYYGQSLDWQPSAEVFDVPGLSDRIQTATLTVPIDYDAPDAGDTTIQVYRQVAADRSEGAIVTNPGGPGGGGEYLVLDADFIFEPEVIDTRDIVSFDPRGVGLSDPVLCRTPAELDATSALVTGSQEAIVAGAQFGDQCAQASPQLLAHVDTSNVARDLDVLRSALSQPKLDYLGYSYGTEIGQRYLQLFPERAGRFVLDGVVDIGLSYKDVLVGQAQGFEASYGAFVSSYVQGCEDGDNDCTLGRTPQQVRESIAETVASLDADPVSVGDGRTLSGSALAISLAYAFYGSQGWDEAAQSVVDAREGDGRAAVERLDLINERSPDGSYAGNAADAYYAVSAADNPTSLTVDQVQQFAAELAQISPLFGPSLAWELWQVSDWPVIPDAQPEPTAADFSGIPQVLLIGGANDPATPRVWAEQANARLPGSVLVVWEGVGHTATGASPCVDEIVSAFFLTGALPAGGTVCPS